MNSGIISQRIVQTLDTLPLDAATERIITDAFTEAGFRVQNRVHHLAILEGESEFACLYLDEGNKLWIRALAQRWWLLFLTGDRLNRFDAFWRAIDTLEVPYEMVQGTVGELEHPNLKYLCP